MTDQETAVAALFVVILCLFTHLIFCVLVALWGKAKGRSWFGTFMMGLCVSPLVSALVVAFTKKKVCPVCGADLPKGQAQCVACALRENYFSRMGQMAPRPNYLDSLAPKQ